MTWIAAAAVVGVALIHVWILILEMFLWQKPGTLEAFGTTAEFARDSVKLAANQGLYNGFLATGLMWALAAYGVTGGRPIVGFFLGCVIVAGVFGAATVNRRILIVQALPAAIALALLWLA
jgi:putative membrane protein